MSMTARSDYRSPQENVSPALNSGQLKAVLKKFGIVRPRKSPKTPIGPHNRWETSSVVAIPISAQVNQ